MKAILSVSFICIIHATASAQHLAYAPEAMVGQRAFSWQHSIQTPLNSRWQFSNVVLYDHIYTHEPNIYFIKNSITYQLNNSLRIEAGCGIKNPGAFGSLLLQYHYHQNNISFSYGIGPGIQNGILLEQALRAHFSPPISSTTNAILSFFASINIANNRLDRGLQQLRIGIKKQQISGGLALNIDQFNNHNGSFFNTGIFLKHQF